ncbi:TldD/PmbA family protein [Candidatus Micrarchaeota archaeon]|nr:TldD/PmbA family protein [Candidatus Micrarchaeota archaeon]
MEYERILSKYGYAELRIERSEESFVRIKDEEIKHLAGLSEGMSVRVLKNGSWGFASSNVVNRKKLEDLLKKAERLTELRKGSIELKLPKPEKKRIKEKTEAVDSEEKVKRLVNASKKMKEKNIISRMVVCNDVVITKEFYSSLGADINQEIAYTYLSCLAIAKSAETIQRGSERAWSKKGFGKLEISETAKNSKEKALRLLKAVLPPKGRFTVVLDPEMTGVFCHEAVGHATEGDSVIDRESVLANKKGQKIGNQLVNIVDDPSAWDFGYYKYDDEGVEGKKTTIVEKGVLKHFLNSMETAKLLGSELNGHARADGYSEVPVVRMSNTYFQPGDSTVDEVFGIKDGIYLKGMKGGSVDIFSGGFMFKAEEAYDIKNGEKGKIMRDVTITGNILETLQNVESVGKDFGTSPGLCGKFGQEMPVSDGGPHIRVKNITIG